MATTNDDATDAQTKTENIEPPIQERVTTGAKRIGSAPFRMTAAATVKAHEVNETLGFMVYTGIKYTIAVLASILWQRAGDVALGLILGALHDTGDEITKNRFNAYAWLAYGATFIVAAAIGLYADAKFQEKFADKRQEQVMTDITSALDAFDSEDDDD